MSRFFRSPSSGSSSSSSSSEDEVTTANVDPRKTEDTGEDTSVLALRNTALRDVYPATRLDSHRDVLLHALLEERCMNEVLSEQTSTSTHRDQAALKLEADRRYQQLCGRLASYNLISSGLEHDTHAATRQRYRDGLDILSHQSTSAATVAPTLRRFLTDSGAASSQIEQDFRRSALPLPLRRVIRPDDLQASPSEGVAGLLNHSASLISQPDPGALFFDSRYQQELSSVGILQIRGDVFVRLSSHDEFPITQTDEWHCRFEEVATLGRGDYGIVYSVRHRLDDQAYAVKKIPLSTARLQRIQRRGQPELEDVLKEIRILAKLDHPNIVRYHAGWIEWSDGFPSTGLVEDEESRQAATGADRERSEMEGLAADDVVFEHSGTIEDEALRLSANAPGFESGPLKLRRPSTRSTMATVSDDSIETVNRTIDPSLSALSTTSNLTFSGPTLALHVQMSLHPMTLQDYIALGDIAPSHCFHIRPSLAILDALLAGLEYLHSQGIIHRDVKPANIFLGSYNIPRTANRAANTLFCNECPKDTSPATGELEVRIGDFGLVSVTDPFTDNTDMLQHSERPLVGTEIYNPLTQETTTPALDIYAAGIVFVELLCPFSTRMERIQSIQLLKEGLFPDYFCEDIGHVQRMAVKRCIRAMLSFDSEVPSVREVRAMIATLRECE